jgi:hypothetical protein
LKADFHFHTCLFKVNSFDIDFFRQSAARAREEGLGAIVITDHHDTARFENIYGTLDRHFPYNGHYYLAEGVRYYPGIEVAIHEGPHLLVSAPREAILVFYERLRPHLLAKTYPTLDEFFAFQEGLGALNIFAHPLRDRHEFHLVPAERLARFDALDQNGKDLHRLGLDHRARIEQLGRDHHLPVLAGSDTHHFLMAGCVYTDFHRPFETIADLRRLIQAGEYTVTVRPDLEARVEAALAMKKAMKIREQEIREQAIREQAIREQ